jgi:cell wall-associated NlpC family hydrolase
VLAAALSQLGKPYQYAAAGPNTYDCSGLTMWAFAHAGISLPHSSQAQFDIGQPVGLGDLQPGDLVFYNEDGTIGHVGIYVGSGNMIDANHTGGWVGVRPLYAGFAGGRRL